MVPVIALRAGARDWHRCADEVERAVLALPQGMGAGPDVEAAVRACGLVLHRRGTQEVVGARRLAEGLAAIERDLSQTDARLQTWFGPSRQGC